MKFLNGVQAIAVSVVALTVLQACAPIGSITLPIDSLESTNVVGDVRREVNPLGERRVLSENRDWALVAGALAGVGNDQCVAISNGKSSSSSGTASIEVVVPQNPAQLTTIYVGVPASGNSRLTAEVKGSRLKLRGLKIYSDSVHDRYWLIGADPLSIKAALAKGSVLSLKAESEASAVQTYTVSLLGSAAILNSPHPDCVAGDQGRKNETEFFASQSAGASFLAEVEKIPVAQESSQQLAAKLRAQLVFVYQSFLDQKRAQTEFRSSLAEGFDRALSQARINGDVSEDLRPILAAAEKVQRRLVEIRSFQESIRVDLQVFLPQSASAASAAQAQEQTLAALTARYRPMFEKNNGLIKELSESQAEQKLAESEKLKADGLLAKAQDELAKVKVLTDSTAAKIQRLTAERSTATAKLQSLEESLKLFDLAAEEARLRATILPALERRVAAARGQLRSAQKGASQSAKDLTQAQAVLSRCREAGASDCRSVQNQLDLANESNVGSQSLLAAAKSGLSEAETALRNGALTAKSQALSNQKTLEASIAKTRTSVDRNGALLESTNTELENVRTVLLPAKEKAVDAQIRFVETARVSLLRRTESVQTRSAALAAFRTANQFQKAQREIEEQIELLAAKRADADRIGREIVRRKQELDTRQSELELVLAGFDDLVVRTRTIDANAEDARVLLKSFEFAELRFQKARQSAEKEIALRLNQTAQVISSLQ